MKKKNIIIFIFLFSLFLLEYFRTIREKIIFQNYIVLANELLKRLNYNIRVITEDLTLDSLDSDIYIREIYFDDDYIFPISIVIKNNDESIKSIIKAEISTLSLLIKNSEKEVMSLFNKIKINIYFIISFTVILFIIFKILIIRNIFSTVNNLQEGAKIIGQGNLDFRIKSVSKNELNKMAISFNRKTKNLTGVMAKKDQFEKESKKKE